MQLHPEHVLIAWGLWPQREMEIQAVVGFSPTVTPLMHLGMTIAKIEAASSVVIARGKVDNLT